MKLALSGGKIITPFRILENSTIIIDSSKIYEIGKNSEITIPANCEIIDVSGKIITPGFVDLLVHGGGGFGFADENDESIEKASDYFIKNGSTTMLAALHAKPHDLLLNDVRRLAKYILKNPDSNIKGIHLEGPFLNPKLKGAMNEDYLWKPAVEGWNELWEASRGLVKIMTIAPELPGAINVMREAANDGVVLTIGHSMANYDEIEAAIDNGAVHITHMFNAMSPFHHRKPGVITGALLRDELKIELIADTLHVHPAIMEMLLKFKKASGIVLITDSIRAGGMHEGEYEFADQKVIMENGKAHLEDGTLAGSTLTLPKAVRNMINAAGAKITEAIRMASLNGAKVLSMENKKGVLASGKDADLVILNDNFEVEMTIMMGKIRFTKK
jgi:N-acetylglucosamine-6-phosphate deacetylase